ncbi:MAG: glycosyltransferase [Deltaproteobacteria bacterium]|nr:glycosyltransferase [Deltaproteobacteria bacterium]
MQQPATAKKEDISANPTRAVSVVIPAHNTAFFLEPCIRSLLNQTFPAHEVIIVNDASTDDTTDIARQFAAKEPGVKVFDLAKNGGAAYARSYGAGKATGAIVAFLDSDCTAPSDWIESIVKEFDADPSLGGVGGRYSHPREKSSTALMAKLEEEYAHQLFAKTPFESNPPGGNSAFLREIWLKKRSGCEAYLFRGINSGEDDFACNEIRRASRIKFVNTLEVVHQPRPAGGYFKRHVNRGRSWAFQLSRGMRQRKRSLEAYGGTGLSRKFFRFVETVNRGLAPGEKISFAKKTTIAFLLVARSACWIYGAGRYFSGRAALRTQKLLNIALSILHFWAPGRISKMFYFVTARCNARCEFCFNLENVENWQARKPAELTLNEVEKIAGHLKRLPYLNLSGGEPFIRADLADIIETFYKRSKTQWVTIPTNASLTKATLETTQEILARCPNLFLVIQVSIDGMHETHDRSRKIRGGFAAMVETLKGLSVLKKWHPNLRVQIATCYDDFNAGQISEIIRFCRENFSYDQQMFYLIRDSGKMVTDSKNHLISRFLATLEENENHEWKHHQRSLWGRTVRVLQGMVYADFVKIRDEKQFIRPCHATQKFVTLYDDGQISPCEVLDSVNLGNIRDFDFDYYKLIRRKEMSEFHTKEIIEKKCQCDWMCAIPMNMLYDVRTLPRLAKSWLKPAESIKHH